MAPSKLAATVATQSCKDLADYWSGLRRPGRLPRRSAVDPGAIRALLPFLYIIELREDGAIVVRLAGTALRRLYGFEMTGRDIGDLVEAGHRAVRRWRYLQAAAHPCGMGYVRRHGYGSGATDELETIFLPLAVDGAAELPARQFIGLAASMSGHRWIADEEGTTLTAPYGFRFLDVGFGTPPSVDPPTDT